MSGFTGMYGNQKRFTVTKKEGRRETLKASNNSISRCINYTSACSIMHSQTNATKAQSLLLSAPNVSLLHDRWPVQAANALWEISVCLWVTGGRHVWTPAFCVYGVIDSNTSTVTNPATRAKSPE